MNGFSRCSLIIELSEAVGPFRDEYLQTPGAFDKDALRVVIHETLHFWQVLGLGYIANLAREEWHAVLEFEKTGRPDAYLSLEDDFTKTRSGDSFSAWQLHEALCRYWDIHIMSPPRLLREHDLTNAPEQVKRDVKEAGPDKPYSGASFDFLMSTELETFRDTYAAIYVDLLKRYGSKASVILFPLVAHFALQTRNPCWFFAEAFDHLASKLRAELLRTPSIHETWRAVFSAVNDECMRLSFHPKAGAALTPGWQVIQRGLREHPVYGYYASLVPPVLEHWGGGADFVLSLPGDDRVRPQLEAAFLPPLFAFPNNTWTKEAPLAKLARVMGTPGLVPPEELGVAVRTVHARVQRMRMAALVSRLQRR